MKLIGGFFRVYTEIFFKVSILETSYFWESRDILISILSLWVDKRENEDLRVATTSGYTP